MAKFAARIRKARNGDLLDDIMKRAAAARPSGREWDEIVKAALVLCGPVHREAHGSVPTFETFAKEWTDGDLHLKWPDHVKKKDTCDRDKQILRMYVNPEIGPLPLDRITLDDADRVMARLPLPKPRDPKRASGRGKGLPWPKRRQEKGSRAKAEPRGLAPASRRHVAQVVAKVMAMAVYPAKYIEASPIPRGWLPKPKKSRAKSYLYPSEDAQRVPEMPVRCVQQLHGGSPRARG